jgi:hypothetical protein
MCYSMVDASFHDVSRGGAIPIFVMTSAILLEYF